MASDRPLEEQVGEALRSTEADPMLGDYVLRRLDRIDAVLVRLAREIDGLKSSI